MPEHSPLPWRESWDYRRVSRDSDRVIGHATGPQHSCKGIHIGDSGSLQPDAETMARIHADAALMVRAVNAHDDLLAALEALTEWGRTYTSPRDANSPHELLIAAVNAINRAKGL